MRIGIVGGGAAGLSAAFELSKHGHSTVVYERAPFLGGQAATFAIGGNRLERGYHHLFRSDRDMAFLMQELGIGDKLQWIPSSVGLFTEGRIWPFMTPLDLLRFAPLSPPARVGLGLAAVRLQRPQRWQDLEHYAAAEVLPKLLGPSAYKILGEPLLRGKFGGRYQEVSMAWFWSKIYLRFAGRSRTGKERLGYPAGSWDIIFDALLKYLKEHNSHVHIGATVRRVLMENGKASGLEVQLPEDGVVEEKFDLVLATVPSFIFPKLLSAELPADYQAKVAGTAYLAAVLAVLELDRPLSKYYWMNIADRSIPFVGVIEHTNYIGPEQYGGNHIVYLSNYLGKDNPHYGMNQDELLDAYVPSLKKINPAFDKSWIREYHYHREEAAQPVIGVDYSKRIPSHRTPLPGLYLANTTQIYPEDRGTNYSIRLGRKVARLMMADRGQQVTERLPQAAIPDSVTVSMME